MDERPRRNHSRCVGPSSNNFFAKARKSRRKDLLTTLALAVVLPAATSLATPAKRPATPATTRPATRSTASPASRATLATPTTASPATRATTGADSRPTALVPATRSDANERRAAASASASTTRGLRFTRDRLDNGLEALLLPDHAAPMVGVFAIIRAGLVHERAGEEGLSHFLEHLLFNGTDDMSQDELYAAVDRLGGYSNATTRDDHTVFQLLVPTPHLERALVIHSQMLFRSTLPPDKFDKERGIVLEEIARDDARAETTVENAFRSLAWEGTPLARPVIGSPETLGAIDRAAVVAYWKRRYVPHNVTVLVVGDVTPERFSSAVRAAYADVPNVVAPRPLVVSPPVRDSVLVTMPADTSRLELRLALAGPDPAHAEVWPLELLASILSDGPGPKLATLLNEAGFTSATGSAALERVAGTSRFVVRVSSSPLDEPRHLLDAVGDALAQASGRLTAADARAAKTRVAVATTLLSEKPHYFGLFKASLLVNAGAGAVEGESAALAAFPVEAIRAAGRRWLLEQPIRALVAGPGLDSSRVALAGSRDFRPQSERAAKVARRHERLDNGLELCVTTTTGAAVFAVHVLIRDRAAREPRAAVGIADMVHRLLARRGDEFDRRVADIGARIKTTDSASLPYDDYYDVPEFGYVRLETIDDYSDQAVLLVGEILSPDFSFDQLESVRATQVAASVSNTKSASRRSAQLLEQSRNGSGHPLARAVRGTPEAVRSLSAEQIRKFARDYLAPGNLIVTVHSGGDVDRIFAKLAATLGTLSGETSPAPLARSRPQRIRQLERELGGSQAYVRLGSNLEVSESDRAAVRLAAAVYSERLQKDIRESRGMAYSIGAGARFRGGDGWPDAWTAAAGTRPENVATVVRAMKDILEQLRTEGPSREELEIVAARAEGRALMRHLSAIGRAYHDAIDLWRGDPPGSSRDDVRALGDLSTSEVHRALRRHFDPARVHIALVR